jgi:hypothetical protein
MKAANWLAATAALLSCDAAFAAAPKLEGTYSLTMTHLCQVLITTPSSGGFVQSIKAARQPHNMKIGIATMTDGNLSFSGTMIEGDSLLVNNAGQKMTQSAVSLGGAFSTTATTFKFKGKTWQAAYAQIDGNNVAHHATFLFLDNPNCATVSTAVMVDGAMAP